MRDKHYYISVSHWGCFPLTNEQALSLHKKCAILDDYLLVPFPNDRRG